MKKRRGFKKAHGAPSPSPITPEPQEPPPFSKKDLPYYRSALENHAKYLAWLEGHIDTEMDEENVYTLSKRITRMHDELTFTGTREESAMCIDELASALGDVIIAHVSTWGSASVPVKEMSDLLYTIDTLTSTEQ